MTLTELEEHLDETSKSVRELISQTYSIAHESALEFLVDWRSKPDLKKMLNTIESSITMSIRLIYDTYYKYNETPLEAKDKAYNWTSNIVNFIKDNIQKRAGENKRLYKGIDDHYRKIIKNIDLTIKEFSIKYYPDVDYDTLEEPGTTEVPQEDGNKTLPPKKVGGDIPDKRTDKRYEPNPSDNPDPKKTIESRLRSLFNKKSRLEQKQASLIKEIKSLTTEARRVYVRQFLNEDDATNAEVKEKKLTHAEADKTQRDIERTLDGKKPNMSSMEEYQKSVNGQKPSTPHTSNEKTDGDETTSTTSTIKVPSNNPVYTAIKDLLARRDQLFKYYDDSVSYFNKIPKNAKYLQDLMSGKYKDFRNMSMKDRISAFNNAKYEFRDNSKSADATQDASSTNTVAPPSQVEQPKPTEQTNSPIRATVAPGQTSTNAGPSVPPPPPAPTDSDNTQPNANSTQRTNQAR